MFHIRYLSSELEQKISGSREVGMSGRIGMLGFGLVLFFRSLGLGIRLMGIGR